MNFTVTPEQEELRQVLRRFLVKRSPPTEVRRLMETADGFDAAVWKELATGLGLHGLGIPEEFGGAGYGPPELCLVFEELGRNLLVAPFFSTVGLAAPLLLALQDDDACARWLPRVADGSLTATVALLEDEAGDWELDGVALRAGPDGRLDGGKTLVPDGATAGLVLVVARDGDGLGVFAVEGDAPGLHRTPLEVLDPTRKLARVELSGVTGRRIGTGDATAALQHALDVGATLLAAEQVGGAEFCLEAAVDYAKLRVQFGRPIGSFQAIKHLCADMLMQVESARSAARFAAWSAGGDDFGRAASVAKAYCSEAYLAAAQANIQIHGGIGVTWEHDAHLYFRRAKASQLLLGSPRLHRRRIADLAGI